MFKYKLCVCMCMYVFIYAEGERERELKCTDSEVRLFVFIHSSTYTVKFWANSLVNSIINSTLIDHCYVPGTVPDDLCPHEAQLTADGRSTINTKHK